VRLLLIFATLTASFLTAMEIAQASVPSYQIQTKKTQDQQIFSKSELEKIPVGDPNIVVGASKKEILRDPIIAKMKSECLSRKMRFTLKKVDKVGSTKAYEPICR
jgi:hypothetical protein